ncbi:MinD/ParA family protein [Persephonella sp.]
MMRDQAESLRNMVKKNRSVDFQVISITSGKGGVGKTSFTVNLAYILQKMGKNVLILDADLALANVDIVLNEKPKYNLLHLLTGEKNINEIIWSSKYGIKFIPAASGFEELANLPKEQQMFILNSLQDIYYTFDIMLIDTSAGISESVINFCLAADKTVVVTTPDPTAVADSYAICRIISNYNTGNMELGLVVNMIENEKEAERIYNATNNVIRKFSGKTIKYYGSIRRDEKLSRSIRERFVLTSRFPNAKYSHDLEVVAKTILEGNMPEKKENFWKKIIQNWINLKFD